MIFFTADQHFGHTNIIRYANRPYQSVAEMDVDLIARWNQRVGISDTVYVLGDFTLGDRKTAADYFVLLNGRINVVPGGHDWRWENVGEPRALRSRSDYPIEILPPLISLENPVIVLCHYAMRVWDRSHYGSRHLHGHSHGRLTPWPNSLDVGVDKFPDLVRLDELPELMRGDAC